MKEREALLEQARLAWLVARREARDNLQDWRILAPILILTLVFPFLMNITARVATDFVERYGAPIIGTRIIPFLLMIVGFFPISFSLVIALESFAGERERLSLEPLLATPISDAALYLGKVLASLVLPLVASLLGIGVYLGSLWISIGYVPPGVLLAQVLLLTAMEALVMVSAAVVISSHTTSVRAANLLASFVIIPVALLVQAESAVMFWGQYEVLWWIAAGLLVVDGLLVRTGVQVFNREELLSGEAASLSLRGIGVRFWGLCVGPVREAWQRGQGPAWRRVLGTVVWFYGEHLPSLVRENWLALATSLVAMAAAGALGWAYAHQYPLPAGALQFGNFSPESLEIPVGSGILPPLEPLSIFVHNARALTLGAVGAPLSFGAAPLLLAMLPMALIGFFAGEVALAGQAPGTFLLAFVLPHGALEIPAAWLAYALALRMGLAVVSPGRERGGLLRALADFLRVFVLVVLPLLLLAAWVEARITPQVVLQIYGAG
ncbi:MAG: stage II sporulation protein M [Anaerolineae bacterium]